MEIQVESGSAAGAQSEQLPKKPSMSLSFSNVYLLMAVSGALLGLSCPGIDQHYLVWFGLVPLFLSIFSPLTKRQTFLRAFVFGLAYNLVYLHWLLFTHPLTWTGFARQIPLLFATAGWLVFSAQQGVIIGLFALAARAIPMCGGFLPDKSIKGGAKQLRLPSFLILPFLWVLILNRLGNAHIILGVPWAMLEYSQYKQLELIQLAPFIGGIGIGALIVLTNCAIAAIVLRVFNSEKSEGFRQSRKSPFFFRSRTRFAVSTSLVFVLLLAATIKGEDLLHHGRFDINTKPSRKIAVIQGNDCPGISRRAAEVVVADFVKMTVKAPPVLCLWTEWSVPASLQKRKDVFKGLASMAAAQKQEWIVGCFDENKEGQLYNSAALLADGGVKGEVYSKRYLVPFGEYVPSPLHIPPLCYLFCTGTPEKSDFASGTKPVVMPVSDYEVSPIICFESIDPELVAQSVRAGGQVILNLSNTIWFRQSIMSDQMIAFAVMRAAECRRSFVFSTNVGPSVFINPLGEVTGKTARGEAVILTEDVALSHEITPFCRFYR